MLRAKNPLVFSVIDGNILIQNHDPAGSSSQSRYQPNPVILDPVGSGPNMDPVHL